MKKLLSKMLLSSLVLLSACGVSVTQINSEVIGFSNGTISNAKFDSPNMMKVDNNSNLYVRDQKIK